MKLELFKLIGVAIVCIVSGGAADGATSVATKGEEQETRKATKVFGLGLSKTATTSFADALKMLDYKTIHSDRALVHYMHHETDQANLTGYYDHVDSVWDIPTAAYYKELHQAYPHAKFVLTVRDSTKWYKSFQEYHNEYLYYRWGCVVPERVQRLHEFVYGSREMNPSWIESMERHNKDVQEYFQQYPDQFLLVDMEKDNMWDKLCTFLDTTDGPCTGRTHGGIYPSFPKSNTAWKHQVKKECPTSSPALAGPVAKNALRTKQTSSTSSSDYAYVTILCDPEEDGQNEFLRMALVLAENIRQFDQTNDMIVLVRGKLATNQRHLLLQMGYQIIERIGRVGGRVPIEDPFHQVDEKASSCYMAKLRALQLTQYQKVMYVDSDILFKSDPSFLFEKPGFVGFEGGKSPLNGGLYVMTPSQQSFADFQDIANTGAFDPKDGWFGVGEIPDWKNPGKLHNWTFWCSFSDQGIVYYYYDILMKVATIYKKVDYEWLFTHFAGTNKPFLYDRDNLSVMTKRYRESAAQWYKLWDIVSQKPDDDTNNRMKEFSFGSQQSIQINEEIIRDRFLQSDPYDEDEEGPGRCGLLFLFCLLGDLLASFFDIFF